MPALKLHGGCEVYVVQFTVHLWPPYVIGQTIYIFILWFVLLSSSLPRLISAVGD